MFKSKTYIKFGEKPGGNIDKNLRNKLLINIFQLYFDNKYLQQKLCSYMEK